jgi:hypothetical protein
LLLFASTIEPLVGLMGLKFVSLPFSLSYLLVALASFEQEEAMRQKRSLEALKDPWGVGCPGRGKGVTENPPQAAGCLTPAGRKVSRTALALAGSLSTFLLL